MHEVGLHVQPKELQLCEWQHFCFLSPGNTHALKTNTEQFIPPQKLGSMLDIVNITKTCGVQKSCIEPMATYFTIEMLGMVEALHKAEILHADIKADNFLLQDIPLPNQAAKSVEEMFKELPSSLQLIDFGKSIDLKLLPKGILFTKV